MPAPKWRRRIVRGLAGLAGAFALLVVSLLVDGWQAFGASADVAVLKRSKQWRDGQMVNPQPLYNDTWLMLSGWFHTSPNVAPDGPVPTESVSRARFDTPPPTGLRVTWLGHSTSLVEIDGVRVLTDPVWGERASPFDWVGPRRWYEAPLAFADLPPIDAVVISHDHYDHLDHRTVIALEPTSTRFIVPVGIGAHLAAWGIPQERITELDWWERTRVGDVEIVSTPSRHASGRFLFDYDQKLWGGWAMVGPTHRVWYSGDTGLHPGMREIGERLGPFDVTMIEVGQYGSGWPDWHLGPEQAVVAHQLVKGKLLLPVHWGTFQLAYHAWTEPIERVIAAAKLAGVTVAVPKAGQAVEPEAPPPLERWWPDVPWRTGAEDPIVATGMDDAAPSGAAQR